MREYSYQYVNHYRFWFSLIHLQGVLFPAMHDLIAKWAPPDEKGKFCSGLLGGAIGTVITWPVAGVLMGYYGWPCVYYSTGAFTVFVSFLWWYLVADTPVVHPRITETEREYIEKSIGDMVSKEKLKPPYFSIMTSIPFLALLLLHYGNIWGLYFLLNEAPTFMKEILKFDLKRAGVLASLPTLTRFILGFVFGSIGDKIRQKHLFNLTFIRKFFCIFCKFISHENYFLLLFVKFFFFIK